jgi:hypothetical protein
LQTIKVVLLSSLNGFAPGLRRIWSQGAVLTTSVRPSSELEEDIKARKGK